MLGKYTLQRVVLGAAVMTLALGVIALQAADEAATTEEKAPSKEVAGTVVKACPSGCVIKVKTAEDEVVRFSVAGKDAKETVKALKAGEEVKLTVVACPKSKKDTVTAVAKVEAETK